MEKPPPPETGDDTEVTAGGDGDTLPREEDVAGLLATCLRPAAEPLQRRSGREEEDDKEEDDEEEGEQRPPRSPDLFAALRQAVSSLERAVFSRHRWAPAPGHEWARAVKSLEELAGSGTERRSTGSTGSAGSGDVAQLQEEAAAAAAGRAALRAALGRRDEELSRAGAALAALRDERDRLQRRARELQDVLSSIEAPCRGSPVLDIPRAPFSAARDPLRRARSYHGATSCRNPPAALPTEPEQRLQRLQGRWERLRAANQLLSAALHDCKSHTERLSMLLGQHEAHGTALRLALHCSERCADAYGALLTLTWARLHRGSSTDERALRELIRRLRAEQAAVLASLRAVPAPAAALARRSEDVRARAERVLRDTWSPPRPRPEPDKAELLQELATLKEALAELRTQLQLQEMQKRGLEVLAAAQGPREDALRLLLLHLQRQRDAEAASSSNSSSSSEEQDAESSCVGAAAPADPVRTAQELQEVLARSAELRARTQALLRALERASAESRAQHVHCSALARDFCHVHSALALAHRGARRRLEAQLRRRQAQAAALGAQQELQVQELARRLQRLEQLRAADATGTTSTGTTGTSETCI